MDAAAELSTLISKADRRALLEIVRESLRRFTERDALQVLRSPFLTADVVEELVVSRRLLSARAVRKALAIHPATPRPIALDSLEGLLWRDLVDIGRSSRTPMVVRRAANQRLLERLPRMAQGERTALARLADRTLIWELFDSPEERVFAALLQNPRLETDDLVRFVSVGHPDPARLSLLAEDPRWNRSPEIRGALFACATTPRAVSISLLTRGTRAEWRRVMEDPSADKLLAACARRLAENDGVDRASRSL